MSHPPHSTPEQREERNRKRRVRALEKWTTNPPKKRKRPADHPWREYRQTKAEGQRASAEQLKQEEVK